LAKKTLPESMHPFQLL